MFKKQRVVVVDPIDAILEPEALRIRQMRETLRLRGDDFDRLFMSVLRAFASYAHTLPASEKHHHAWQGGLLSHSLDVALGSTRASSAFLYGHRVSPKHQDQVENQWRLAIAFTGLLHDCGKIFTGMKVTDDSGMKRWDPYQGTLIDWFKDQNVDRYRIEWEKSRQGHHEVLGAGLLHKFISPEIQSFLMSHHQNIWQSMTETIAGMDEEERFGALVRSADQDSVARDLTTYRTEPAAIEGERPETSVIQIIMELANADGWKLNVPGSRLWFIDGFVHLVWKSAAQDIAEKLQEKRIRGVPRETEALAELLIERGIAIPQKRKSGEQEPFWKISPPGVSISLNMLRLIPGILPDIEKEGRHEASAHVLSGAVKEPPLRASPRELNIPATDSTSKVVTDDVQKMNDFFGRIPRENAESLFRRDSTGIYLYHVLCAETLKVGTDLIIQEVTQNGWHLPDPHIPSKPVRRILGRLAILLKPGVGQWVTNHFDIPMAVEHPMTVVKPKGNAQTKEPSVRSILENLPPPSERPPLSELQKRSKVMPWRRNAK